MQKKTLLIFRTLIILNIFIGNNVKASSFPPVLVEVDKVIKQNVFEVLSTPALLKPKSRSMFHADIDGTLDYIIPQELMKVKKGDVLFTIDKKHAQSIMQNAKNKYDFANKKYERVKKLFQAGYIAKKDLEEAESNLILEKKNLSEQEIIYNKMIVTSNMDGMIGIIKPKVGDYLAKGTLVLEMVEEGVLESVISLPSKFHKFITSEIEIYLTDQVNDKVKAKVEKISPALDELSNLQVFISVNQGHFLSNSYAVSEVILNPHYGLTIPEKAISINDEGSFVYKVVGDKVQQVKITTGTRIKGMVEIFSNDLKEGDEIVVEGLTKISNGSNIRTK